MRFDRIRLALAVSVATIALTGTAMADNLNRVVEIVNDTGFTIIEFYGSHTDAKTWEEDILGADVLPSGRSVNINFDDGTGYCIFDFKAVFDDGDVLEKYDVNVCEIGTFTYN